MINQASADASLKVRHPIFRIVLFSPAKVVTAVATFTELTHKEKCELPAAELALYKEMRGRIISEDVTNQVIAMALFGCKLEAG